MMMTRRKLTDAELAMKTRAANQRRAERQRERKGAAGYVQMVVWVPLSVRAALDRAVAANESTLSSIVERYVVAGLTEPEPSARPAPANTPPVSTLPLFDAPAPVEDAPAPVDRDSRILALKREQPDLSNYAIAAQVGCSEPTVRRALKRLNLEATG